MDNRLDLVQSLCRNGATDEILCEKLRIGKDTLYKWKREKPQFKEALKESKEEVDLQVENALLRNALGYEYYEDTVTNKGEVVRIKRHKPPNTTAQIFWLKNRKPREWREKQEMEHSGAVPVQIIDDIQEEEEE